MFFLEELVPLDYKGTYNIFDRLVEVLITNNNNQIFADTFL